MGKGTAKFVKNTKQLFDNQLKFLNRHLGEPLAHLLDLPIKIVLSPFTLANDISGSAPRGFGIPEFISKLSYSTIFAVAALGTCDIALELGKKGLWNLQWMECATVYHVQRHRESHVPGQKLHIKKWRESNS